jgi:Family of unknown function (DUF6049)/Glycosyl hydrolase family 57
VKRTALAGLAVAAVLAVPVRPASAQEDATVLMTLLEQTPYATPDRPLQLRVAVENETDLRYGELTLALGVYSAVPSRSEYAQAVESDPVSAIHFRTFPVPGPLEAGQSRNLDVGLERLGFLTDRADNALYPVTVELRSNDVRLATLRTVLVFIADSPKVPLDVSISFVLDHPLRVHPDGTFLDDSLEDAVRPGGRLDVIVSALEAEPIEVTLALSPVLLEQLQAMRDGYRRVGASGIEEIAPDHPVADSAGRLLDRIREIARLFTTEVVALPYASPSVPALVRAGLEDDLVRQVERGRAAITGILGVEPVSSVFRPPGSSVTPGALPVLADTLRADGTVDALLLDADVLPPPEGLQFTPNGLAQLEIDAEQTLPAITPDPGVEARTIVEVDPRLRAQWTLGELSAIYFEQPSLPRAVALLFDEGDAPGFSFLRPLLRGIRAEEEAQWLRPVKASRLLETPAEEEPDVRQLDPSLRSGSLPPSFLGELPSAKDALASLASMAEQPDLIQQLERLVLVAEARSFAGEDDLRLAYLRALRQGVGAEFDKVQPPQASSITLTSRRGLIPVTLHSEAGYPVTLEVTLRSSRLEFLGGGSQEVTLSRPSQRFDFPVRAQTTGRFPVDVELRTPDGARIATSSIVVRSTAYNRVALVVTIGAALFLALLWGRRFLSRPRT